MIASEDIPSALVTWGEVFSLPSHGIPCQGSRQLADLGAVGFLGR